MSTEKAPRGMAADDGAGRTEWRVTFTHFDYTGGPYGVPLNPPSNEPPGNDWQFASMMQQPLEGYTSPPKDHSRPAGMLLILWKRERTEPQAPVTLTEEKLAAYRDSTIREALRIAMSAAENDRQAERFEAALAAMDREG